MDPTVIDPHLTEWLNLAVRWFHVIAGVAWIGASFYFNWLENNLDRGEQQRAEGIAGHLWAVHGGGFYYLEKYKVAPPEIPKALHWFKWEAYFTWISGVTLLLVVYHLNNSIYLLGLGSPVGRLAGLGISLGALVGAWIVYDLLQKSPLGRSDLFLGIVLFGLFVGAAFGLSEVFTGRAAYLHVGAMIGTIMAANVFFVIIPAQKEMVDAATAGRERDPRPGQAALKRSRHNNYFTLPVLFVMVSSHYPSTYGHPSGWALLAGISAAGIGIRHYFNVRHQPNKAFWVLPAATVAMVAFAFVARPGTRMTFEYEKVSETPVAFADVHQIISTRCTSCHSSSPNDDAFRIAPGGVRFDTAEDVVKYAERIVVRASHFRTMPFANKTGMTVEERNLIWQWVQEGAQMK